MAGFFASEEPSVTQSPSQIYVGLGVQTARGSAGTLNYFPAVRSPEFTPMVTQLEDKGLRGSMADVFNLVQGVRHDEVGWSGDVFLDSIPALLRSVLGSADTKTGTAAPVSHAFSLKNTVASNDTQPPAYTFTMWDGYAYRQFKDAQADSLSIKYTAANLLEYTYKALSLPFTTVSAPTQVLPTLKPIPSWDASVTINGVSTAYLVDGSIDFKRGTKPIHAAAGSQAPYRLWAGPLSCSGKITLVREDDTELNAYLANNQGTLDLTFTDPANPTQSLKLHMTSAGFKSHKPNYGKEWIEQDLEFIGIPTSTDATDGGLSPVKATVTNAIITSY